MVSLNYLTLIFPLRCVQQSKNQYIENAKKKVNLQALNRGDVLCTGCRAQLQ